MVLGKVINVHGKDKQSCLLRVKDKAKYYLQRDNLPNMKIVEQNGEFDIVKMEFHNEVELFSFVKQWMPDIKIIDNKILSDKLTAQIEDFLRN